MVRKCIFLNLRVCLFPLAFLQKKKIEKISFVNNQKIYEMQISNYNLLTVQTALNTAGTNKPMSFTIAAKKLLHESMVSISRSIQSSGSCQAVIMYSQLLY